MVPLLVAEPTSAALQKLFGRDRSMLVWWATELECVSAISRLEQLRALSANAATEALERLDALKVAWSEVQPLDGVRRVARRLLRIHPLRAADALQLAAAVVAAEGDASALELVALDERLIDAGRREGFAVADPGAR